MIGVDLFYESNVFALHFNSIFHLQFLAFEPIAFALFIERVVNEANRHIY